MNSSQAEQVTSRLLQHPKLLERLSRILDLVENKEDSCTTADEAEARTIEELHHLGGELLHDWVEQETCIHVTSIDRCTCRFL